MGRFISHPCPSKRYRMNGVAASNIDCRPLIQGVVYCHPIDCVIDRVPSIYLRAIKWSWRTESKHVAYQSHDARFIEQGSVASHCPEPGHEKGSVHEGSHVGSGSLILYDARSIIESTSNNNSYSHVRNTEPKKQIGMASCKSWKGSS